MRAPSPSPHPLTLLGLVSGLVVSAVLLPALARAQVVNGSFEDDGQPSLSGWETPCGATFRADTPPGGGTWSLKLAPGNLQGCFPSRAVQEIPQAQDGEVWRLSAWVRQDTASFTTARLFWMGSTTADTTTSPAWTLLSVEDTLKLAPGTTAAIVLDAGQTTGPGLAGSGYLFDLVTVERVSGTAVRTEEQPEEPVLRAGPNYPNPFTTVTRIPFTLREPGFVRLDVFDVRGRTVATVLAGPMSPGLHVATWDAEGRPPGTYFARLQRGGDVRIVSMVRQ